MNHAVEASQKVLKRGGSQDMVIVLENRVRIFVRIEYGIAPISALMP